MRSILWGVHIANGIATVPGAITHFEDGTMIRVRPIAPVILSKANL